VDDNAEEVHAFGGSADLLAILNAAGDVFLELVDGGADVEIAGDGIAIRSQYPRRIRLPVPS
jgi:hypothetical protein